MSHEETNEGFSSQLEAFKIASLDCCSHEWSSPPHPFLHAFESHCFPPNHLALGHLIQALCVGSGFLLVKEMGNGKLRFDLYS